MAKLPFLPVEHDDESFGSFVFRTLRLYIRQKQGLFVRRVLGYRGKQADNILATDLRLPPQDLLARFSQAVHNFLGEGTLAEVEADYRRRTLWPVLERLQVSPEECLRNPLLMGPETVCPACLAAPVPGPPYRRLAWQPGFATVCLDHEQPVLLTDTCLRGGSVAASVLKGRLPKSAGYHFRTPQCAGCDLSAIVPAELNCTGEGVVVQEVLQVKLAGWGGDISPAALRLLESERGSLAPAEFWKHLNAHVTLAAFLLEANPTQMYDPLRPLVTS